jgi:hypothetical protein
MNASNSRDAVTRAETLAIAGMSPIVETSRTVRKPARDVRDSRDVTIGETSGTVRKPAKAGTPATAGTPVTAGTPAIAGAPATVVTKNRRKHNN